MLKNILVPLDGSENAEHIGGWIAGLAYAMNAQVTLLAVVDPTKKVFPGSSKADNQRIQAALLEQAKSYLESEAIRMDAAGIATNISVKEGNAAEQIIEASQTGTYDMIAMATHRGSSISRGLLGSVTDRVIRNSNLPVLTIRPRELSAFVGNADAPSVIIVPLDGSEQSEEAVALGLDIAEACGASIIFMQVVHFPYYMVSGQSIDLYASEYGINTYRRSASVYLDDFVEKAKSRKIIARGHTPIGHPATRIIEVAESETGSLIVMTTRGMSGIKRWVLGSVSDRVIRSSGQPVLLVRSS